MEDYQGAEIQKAIGEVLQGCLDLPERLKLPERPSKYRKDQRIIGN